MTWYEVRRFEKLLNHSLTNFYNFDPPEARRCSSQISAEKLDKGASRGYTRRKRIRVFEDFCSDWRRFPGTGRGPDLSSWSLSVLSVNRRLRALTRPDWSSCWPAAARWERWGWRTARTWSPESGRPSPSVPWGPSGLGRVCRGGRSDTFPSRGRPRGRPEATKHPEKTHFEIN